MRNPDVEADVYWASTWPCSLMSEITLEGGQSCGWTKKQLDYLDKKGLPYTFVDCDKGGCPSFVSAFPTLDHDGKILEGFRDI